MNVSRSPAAARATASVTVCHLGGQHAGRLVEALARCGELHTFVTGVAFASAAAMPFLHRLARRTIRAPSSRLVRRWLVGLLSLCPQRLIPSALRIYWNHLLLWWFDQASASLAVAPGVRTVTAFENAALAVFENAKRSGIACVLECPSVHHSHQLGEAGRLERKFVTAVDRRKDREIKLADRIVVLSAFAKETFVSAGISPDKIEVVHPGVDCAAFPLQPMTDVDGPIRFLFVGHATYGKGVDVLASAFSRLPEGSALLRLVGVATPLARRLASTCPGITLAGPMDRGGLLREYRAAHVVVLPSRFDGFGLVVTEAMACGRPVIVSSHVGASDVVVESGDERCGWIVPVEDAESLRAAMEEAVSNRKNLAPMGAAARRIAEKNSWLRYEERIEAFYKDVCDAAPQTCAYTPSTADAHASQS